MRLKERRETGRTDLLRSRLDAIIDMSHPLVKLARDQLGLRGSNIARNGYRIQIGPRNLLLPPLPRHGRERAAFAIARVLEVDPVVRIDVFKGNAVARP